MNKILLVVAIVIVSIVSAKAQYLAEQPSTGFQSTSAMVSSGSTFQTGGEFMSADTYYETATGGHRGAARKGDRPGAGPGEEQGGPESGDRPDPYMPIGDGMWVLMAMAAGAALLRKRKAASGER
ncbi:MAG: hypothetical protein KBS69_06960 [Bacteroidales bacterium]|nr:hypothetical protein [Candidatus Colicola caccequi]